MVFSTKTFMIQIFLSPIIEFIKGKKCVAIFYKKEKGEEEEE